MTDSSLLTAGIDVGSASIKVAVMRDDGTIGSELLAGHTERIRRRDTLQVVEDAYRTALAEAGVDREQLDYIATTGEGERVAFRTGHFYGMTTHARGALYLDPETRAVVDIGALHTRAMLIDERAKVLSYRMTSQCASGSGQFLENSSRYLGVPLEEIGPISLESTQPEQCSSICAVLAETDVINMVSRGISTADILKGIHLSMAGRYVKLLNSVGARGVVVITGGLAGDVGLVGALREAVAEAGVPVEIRAYPQSILAGAIGAALWGAFRHRKLGRLGQTLATSP